MMNEKVRDYSTSPQCQTFKLMANVIQRLSFAKYPKHDTPIPARNNQLPALAYFVRFGLIGSPQEASHFLQ